jgi:hypothetical protein
MFAEHPITNLGDLSHTIVAESKVYKSGFIPLFTPIYTASILVKILRNTIYFSILIGPSLILITIIPLHPITSFTIFDLTFVGLISDWIFGGNEHLIYIVRHTLS